MAKGTLIYQYRDPAQLAACISVVWSPDGERIAVGEVGGRIHIFHLSTTHHYILYPGNDLGGCASLDWSPDSTHLVAGYADGTVLVWRPATGEIDWTFRGD